MRYKLVFPFLLALGLLTAKNAIAQNLPALKTGATLTGVVLGTDGRPVAKASVSCQSAGGLAPHAVYTDAKGRFTVNGLKQDSYDLRAFSNGTYSNWVRNLPLRKGQTKTVTLHLLDHASAAGNPTPAAQKKP
jgi:Carboxypeptidase regulatory-like domain